MKHEHTIKIDFHLHRDESGDRVILDTLADLVTSIAGLHTQGKKVLMANAEVKAILERINIATDNIAADVRRLTEGVGTGMTEAEVAEVKGIGEGIAAKLEGIAASTEDPIPEP